MLGQSTTAWKKAQVLHSPRASLQALDLAIKSCSTSLKQVKNKKIPLPTYKISLRTLQQPSNIVLPTICKYASIVSVSFAQESVKKM